MSFVSTQLFSFVRIFFYIFYVRSRLFRSQQHTWKIVCIILSFFQMKIVVAKLQFQSKTLTTLTFYRVDGISNGVIIGVVLGNLFILAVGLIVVFMYRRRKHLSECIFTVYITMHVTQNLFSYLIFFSNFTMYQRNTTLLYLFKKKFFLTICIVYFF